MHYRPSRPVPLIALFLVGVVPALGAPQTPARDLTDPSKFTATAPATFTAVFETTAGTFVIRATRAWAPYGVDRFYNLVKAGFYDECRFFRVVPKFMVQFGLNGDPAVTAAWSKATLPPDRPRTSNTRGRVTFAQNRDPSSRATQVFINYGDNSRLDIDGFAPIGEVISSMLLVERIFSGYGEGPDQSLIETLGNKLLIAGFPQLDYIKRARIDD
jgi:peptidyl-prolyl cis-trans isomerase A (cyclophilin A)